MDTTTDKKKTRILILGAGFGGTYAALRLEKTLAKRDDCEVTLVDRANFILFTPMLHEVAASDLDPSDIVNPIRKMLRRVTFFEAIVQTIDLEKKRVEIAFGFPRQSRWLEFDHLVVALGSTTKFFNDETAKHAVEMKTLGDALFLRNRMIGMMESANVCEQQDFRSRLLTYVVAGGGFAGVETIGAMNDFLRDAIRFYPRLDPKQLRVILVHPGETLLPEFDKELGQYTGRKLAEAGIDVRYNTKVENYDGTTVKLDKGDPIEAGTLLWTAGVAPDRLVEQLPLKKDKGRIVVNGCMQSEEMPGIWAVGDSASVPNPHEGGKPYASTAQTAIRQGPVLAKNIEAVVLGGVQKPFSYKVIGQLAAIGQRNGTAQIFGFRFSGFFAWFLWRGTYLSKLPRLEKKLRVAIAWALDLVFSRDLVQMITVKDIERITNFGVRYQLGPSPENSPPAGSKHPGPEKHPDQSEAEAMASPT